LYRDTRDAHKNLYPASFAKATEAERRQKVRPRFRFAAAGQAPPPCTPAAPYARAGRGVTALWLKYQDRDRMLRRVTRHPCKLAPSLKLPARQFLNARPSLLPGRYVAFGPSLIRGHLVIFIKKR